MDSVSQLFLLNLWALAFLAVLSVAAVVAALLERYSHTRFVRWLDGQLRRVGL